MQISQERTELLTRNKKYFSSLLKGFRQKLSQSGEWALNIYNNIFS